MINNRPLKLIELAILRAQFESAEIAAQELAEPATPELQALLDNLGSRVADLENELSIPNHERYFPY
jgi:hypothetical protein